MAGAFTPLLVFLSLIHCANRAFQTHSVLSILVEGIYFRLSSRQLRDEGQTTATDIADVHLSTWIVKGNDHLERRHLKWWSLILMLLLTTLLPSEILLESGIYERKDCTPKSIKSAGVCASPWKGQANVFISSASLLTAYSNWIEPGKWQVVLEGSRKKPRISEVRNIHAKKEGRRIVLASCDIRATRCDSNTQCGNLIAADSKGTYGVVVTSSSLHNVTGGPYFYGDVQYDRSGGFAFMFWPSKFQQQKLDNSSSRKRITVLGIETAVSERDSLLLSRIGNASIPLSIAPSQTFLYDIHCDTDGLRAEDLAHSIGIYRTMQAEQCVSNQCINYNSSINGHLSSSDILKSAYALKSADASDTCSGDIDVYRECGDFETIRIAPFCIGAAILGIIWITVKLMYEFEEGKVPVDAKGWRRIAHNQALALRHMLRPSREYAGVFDKKNVSHYSDKKYEAQAEEALASRATTSTVFSKK